MEGHQAETRAMPEPGPAGAARGSGVRSPGRGEQQLVFLGPDQRPELARERHERLVGEHRLPEPRPVGIVGELPQVHDLVHRPDVADEVADEPALRVPAERGPAFAPIELPRLRKLADIQRIGPQLVDKPRGFPFIPLRRARGAVLGDDTEPEFKRQFKSRGA